MEKDMKVKITYDERYPVLCMSHDMEEFEYCFGDVYDVPEAVVNRHKLAEQELYDAEDAVETFTGTGG